MQRPGGKLTGHTVVAHSTEQPAPRIATGRLLKRLVWALLVPVTAAFAADAALGTSPWLAVAAALICIPLATLLVSQAALHELNKVIEQVAPPEEAVLMDDGPGSGERSSPENPQAD